MNNADVEPEDETSRLKEAARKLGEEFDTVQIFATKHGDTNESGTRAFFAGVGNWYARFGQVVRWIAREDEDERSDVRKSKEEI